MDSYDPLGIVYQLRVWVEKSLGNYSSLGDTTLAEAKVRYHKIIKIINGLENLQIPIPENINLEKENLENILKVPSEEKGKLAVLAKELSTLAIDIKRQLRVMRSPKITEGKKAPPKGLQVTFPDGVVFCESTATKTFIRTLQHIGLERVSELQSIRTLGHPLVSTQKNESAGNAREIDGYYIETLSSTETKAKYIRGIASNLNIDIMVNVIEK